MKCVIDTNVIFSALYDIESIPGALLLLAIYGSIEWVAPESVRTELIRNLEIKLQYSPAEIEDAIQELPITWIDALVYEPYLNLAPEYVNHENDYPIIACALALKADIVSGNKRFHPLKKEGLKVWGVRELLYYSNAPNKPE
jgi:predicted nucleic acid-binding protein